MTSPPTSRGSKEEDDVTYKRCTAGHHPKRLLFDMFEPGEQPDTRGRTNTSVQATTRIIPAPLRRLARDREVIHHLLEMPISGPSNTIASHRFPAC
jgi:hypothetical protein